VNRFSRKHGLSSRKKAPAGLFTLSLIFFSLHIPFPAYAVSFSTFGFGPKAIGMGQAFSAIADDFSAAWYNPAGMTQNKGIELGLGYQYMRPFLKIDGQSFRVQDSHSIAAGFSLPIPFSAWLKDRVFLGLAFYMPWDLIFGIKVPLPQEPQFLLLENEPRDIVVAPAVAIELHPALSLGCSVILNDNTFGSFEATLTPENEVVLDVNQELPVTFTPSASLFFQPGGLWPSLKEFRMGFTWRDDFLIEYEFTPLIGLGYIPLIINFAASSLYQPQQFTLGLSYAPVPRLLFGLDLSYNLWSRMPDPNLVTSFNFVFPIFPVEFAPTKPYLPGFNDTFVPRVGVQYQVKESNSMDVFLRAGYSFEESPVPSQSGFTNYMDSDKHIFSFSPEIRLKQWSGKPLRFPVSLGGYVQLHYLKEHTFEKEHQLLQMYPEYPYPTIQSQGTILTLGIFASTSFDWR